jgi:hypothetical protein
VDDVLVVVAKHHDSENGNPHDERSERHGSSRTPHSLPYLPITEKLWQSTPVSLAGQTASRPARKRPLPPLFAERARAAQLAAALVVPAVFGAIVGLMLGVSAAAYWGLQIVAAIGGLLAGLEHRTGADAADRGFFGGLVFGSFLLLAHAISGADAKVSLGQWPGVLIVLAGIAGALLGALGGTLRAALERRG